MLPTIDVTINSPSSTGARARVILCPETAKSSSLEDSVSDAIHTMLQSPNVRVETHADGEYVMFFEPRMPVRALVLGLNDDGMPQIMLYHRQSGEWILPVPTSAFDNVPLIIYALKRGMELSARQWCALMLDCR